MDKANRRDLEAQKNALPVILDSPNVDIGLRSAAKREPLSFSVICNVWEWTVLADSMSSVDGDQVILFPGLPYQSKTLLRQGHESRSKEKDTIIL